MNKCFADSISMQLTLTDYSLALKVDFFVLHRLVVTLHGSKMVLAGLTGCPDPE